MKKERSFCFVCENPKSFLASRSNASPRRRGFHCEVHEAATRRLQERYRVPHPLNDPNHSFVSIGGVSSLLGRAWGTACPLEL